jgi:beta-lactamase superfamily II metal-dependent hydrolase
MHWQNEFSQKSARIHIQQAANGYDSCRRRKSMKKLLTFLLCALVLLMSACSTSAPATEMTVTVFSAGKADAILIETQDGNVLIDAGLEENRAQLLEDLAQRGVSELEALIITHFDKDHVGGADAVLETLKVNHVYTTWQSKSSDDITSYEQALFSAGLKAAVMKGTQTFTLGGAIFTIYGASDAYEEDESNNSSLIVHVSFGKKSYLFMGDAQDERIEEFLSYGEADADFLKVPYHGHYQDSLEELISAVTPEAGVITNGTDEPSEKEIKKTVKILEAAGSAVYETLNGTVEIRCTQEGFTVSQ